MEDKIKNVSLSFCCNKEWKNFSHVDDRRRFCDSCQHHVVDFRKTTSEDFEEAVKGSRRVCGYFTRSQMSESFLKAAAGAVIASSLSMACETSIEPATDKAPSIENTIPSNTDVEEFEHGFVGIVFDPADTLVQPLDSLLAHPDEDRDLNF